MFTLHDRRPTPTCAGLSRRDFLTVGSLALGGLSLPRLLAAESAGRKTLRDKAVVLLFLQGGPSHIEFFDPKMTAPEGIRSITGEVKTKLPGVTFGGTFQKLAARTDKFTIVRSFASGNGGHTYESVSTGGNPLKASMGAIYSRLAGSTHPRTGMPGYVLVKPEAVDPTLKLGSNFETGALPSLVQPGELGAAHAAFDPAGGGQLLKNLKLSIAPDRFEDRKALLRQLDSFKSRLDRTGEMESATVFEQRAFEVLAKGIADAFDLKKEDPRTIARYDTSSCFKASDITKRFDMKRASNLLGKQMLMARRLIEAGAGFVTVSDCGWDMHANKNTRANLMATVLQTLFDGGELRIQPDAPKNLASIVADGTPIPVF